MLRRVAASALRSTSPAWAGARAASRLWEAAAPAPAPFSAATTTPDPPPPPHAPGTVTPLTSDKAAADAMAGPGPAVLDYTAAWCGPCRAMKTPYAALAAAHPSIRFHTVDIDDPGLEATVAGAGISAVPTFTFHERGKLVACVQGADLGAVTAAVEELATGKLT